MIYTPSGELRTLIGFDCETYLISPHRGAPRAVCGTLATLGSLHGATGALPSGCIYEERGGNGVAEHQVALLLADDMVRVMARLIHAMAEAPDAAESPVLVAQNGAFDLGVLLVHAELMEARGDVEAGFAAKLHESIFLILDLNGTGLPDSPSLVLDTMLRDKLISNACGEPVIAFKPSLADLVAKHMPGPLIGLPHVDRTVNKKGTPCTKCNASGEVPGAGVCPRCKGAKYLIPWRMRFAELDGLPLDEWPQAPIDYALDDAMDVVLVAIAQGGDFGVEDRAAGAGGSGEVYVDELGGVHYEATQVRTAWCLQLSALNGPRSNPDSLAAWRAVMENLHADGNRIGQGGLPRNDDETVPDGAWIDSSDPARRKPFIRPNGTKDTKVLRAMVEAAFKKLGSKPPRTKPSDRYPQGQTKTDARTITKSGDPILRAWSETGEGKLAVEKFIPAAERGLEYAVHSSPDTFKVTDRMSWSKPAFHQPPRKAGFRECWEARPGTVYVSSDWSGAEMVALAQIQLLMFGDSKMADLINAHGSGAMHLELARLMHNAEHPGDVVDLIEATHRYDAGDKGIDGLRQGAKIGNFGFAGGMSARTFVQYALGFGVTLTESQADAIRDAWLQMGANQEYLDFFKAISAGDGFTYKSWVTGMLRGNTWYTNGCNHGFQSLIAAALKVAMWWTTREMFTVRAPGFDTIAWNYPHSPGEPDQPREIEIEVPSLDPDVVDPEPSPLFGWRAWLWIHDEGLLEGPEAGADAAARRFSDLMVAALDIFAPDLHNEAEPGLGRVWSKGIKPAFDAHGKLVPWDG